MPNQTIIDLFQTMHDLTNPDCANECRAPRSCCDAMYCDITRAYALDEYGISLPVTGHPTLPYMGSEGCTVEAYLRPLCTLHVCSMNSLGIMRTGGKYDPDKTARYFAIREAIDDLENVDV